MVCNTLSVTLTNCWHLLSLLVRLTDSKIGEEDRRCSGLEKEQEHKEMVVIPQW
jgi:hypothetical protein